ncbi:hypothetical protein BDEG_20927 [Batrachochytrium dendrobatidis JEL423]|nr:hypothetical protein BDEG_20927 [Batrachochytrium dendrobatidis JEL423]
MCIKWMEIPEKIPKHWHRTVLYMAVALANAHISTYFSSQILQVNLGDSVSTNTDATSNALLQAIQLCYVPHQLSDADLDYEDFEQNSNSELQVKYATDLITHINHALLIISVDVSLESLLMMASTDEHCVVVQDYSSIQTAVVFFLETLLSVHHVEPFERSDAAEPHMQVEYIKLQESICTRIAKSGMACKHAIGALRIGAISSIFGWLRLFIIMSSSKKQQLAICKAALEALQTKIDEAEQERKTAKTQLEKAIQEGKAVSSYEKLLDSATAFLTGLQSKEKELLKRESQLTRSPSTSDDEMQEIPPKGSPKRRKVDDLIEKSKRYLFRTERWGCVTVIKKRRAVTFAHTEHSSLQPGMSMKIYSTEGNVEYDVKVVKTNAESDWVLLESDVDLCEKEPIWEPVVDGHRYVQLGLSALHQQESPFAISTGVISSQRPNMFGHTLGSSGANPGDSGGGCFDQSSGCLVGINVGCENASFNPDMDTVTQTYHKISTRFATRAHIIPINSFQFV